MPVVRSALFVAAISAFGAAPCIAQSPLDNPAPLAPQRQFSIDVGLAGVSVGYATRNSSRTSFGASIGVGGNWWNYMVLAGRHFAEPRGISYQGEKDGATNKELFELLRANVFVRTHFDDVRQLDVGLKASGFLHSDSSDDDPGGGTFVGLNMIGTWAGWRRIKLGSEIDAGRYGEGRLGEFGVNVAPLLVRITIP